ncbi:GyrI-like domain-containing protein [Rufibacter latericius]|uniref:AraC family transcriptional regulator n=1 Tax=Rufibacter latericius TaxID=2487040 RepID=A0A3M9MMZ8_9BACT|nr:GyrI-like domain-containing protein [Rufibacter latericius]RNI26889.1 AraC family transcriptional regulator [Rufibacter latericius]
MRKKLLIFLAIVAILVLVGYTYLGGFAEVKVSQTVSTPVFIAGKYYAGSIESEALGQIYQQAGKAVDQKQLTGDFAGIYYNNPSKDSKTIKAFIGVAIQDTTAALPAGFTVRVVPAGRPVLRGELEANIMLAPKRIYGELFDYAEEQNLALQEFYVERFPQGKPAVIEVGLAKK